MSDLDTKLKEIKIPCQHILQNRNSTGIERGVTLLDEKTIAQIKQALADEGYIHIDRYSGGGIAIKMHGKPEILRAGQEFNKRFIEIITPIFNERDDWTELDIFKAAKKAAGLK